MPTRRSFLKLTGASTLAWYVATQTGWMERAMAAIPGGTLDPADVDKYVTPMLIPPVMPRAATITMPGGKPGDYYEISMKQISQQILPARMAATTVWGYGAVTKSATSRGLVQFWHAPSLTIESTWKRPVRIKWINQLVDDNGHYLPHLLPVDQTLHWANPPGGVDGRDMRPTFTSTPGRYTGPVPIVTHLHGAAGVGDESDGYAEAWYLPAAGNIPGGYATQGTWYDFFAGKANSKSGVASGPGFAVFQFPPNKTYYEIPIAVQDRSFNTNGALFYPDTRAFFDGIEGPYIPDTDVSPIWNPEFFGNMIIANGNTWPFQTVERRRYRLRFLNGCQSRFLILDFNNIPGVEVWQIGNEGGFLAAPVNLTANNGNRLLMGLAERVDLIVDFTNVPVGNYVLGNVGPDEPFGGGEPPGDFDSADPDTTGQVMQFRVVPPVAPDPTTPPQFLVLPAITRLTGGTTRPLALLEQASAFTDGPAEAQLGIVNGDPNTTAAPTEARRWMDEVTENPAVGATEVWEYYNTTADAHPMHIHEVAFQVVNRQDIVIDEENGTVQVAAGSAATPPEPWENGWKDTVVAYPGQVTRLRLRFTNPGQFVWHCHIVEHEDNEMMRPYRIGPPQPGQPAG